MTLVAVDGVTKVYGGGSGGTRVDALAGVDLSFDAGEYVAVMGPSGCGKSTLLSVIGAMNPPSAGKVSIDGIDVYSLTQERQADLRREYIGFVFQQLELIPYLSALENVLVPLAITKENGKREMAMDALRRVGLDEAKARRLPSELSGGEQGRVAIARAIVNDPPLLLADEPVGSLDRATGRQILALLGQLVERGHTVVMVTHNPESVEDCHRVIGLLDGEVASDEAEHCQPAGS